MLTQILSLLMAAACAAADQLLKRWAAAVLRPLGVMPLLPGIVELRYTVNDGMAFSLLSGQQKLLIAVTGVILVAVLVWLLAGKMAALERAAWVLVLGGGIGNLVDRVARGQVVDYINLLFMRFAVFNFADICVSVGVGLLVLHIVLDAAAERRGKAAPPAPGDAPKDAPDADG